MTIVKDYPSQDAIRQSEERYKAFVQNSSEGIWRLELEAPVSTKLPEEIQIAHFFKHGVLAECNDAMARMYGLSEANELVGARLPDLLIQTNPDNLDFLRHFIRSDYRLVDAESTEKDTHGRTKYFLNNFVGVVENGMLVRAWGTQRDITEKKKAVDQLHQIYQLNDSLSRAKKLEQIYEETLLGLQKSIACDKASILLFDDDDVMRFKGALGLSDEYKRAVEGHSPWKKDAKNPTPILVSNAMTDPFVSDFLPVLLKEKIGALAFIPLVRQDQLIGKFMVYFSTPHTFPPDEIQLIQTVANHVAFAIARKRDEEKLQHSFNLLADQAEQLWRSNKELEQFAFVSSHDLKEPLRAISSYAQLLDIKHKGTLGEESDKFINNLMNSVDRMQQLIDDLLAFSRVGRGQVELSTVNLQKVFEHVMSDLKVAREESGAIITHDPLPEVNADSTQIHQLLLNLLANAMKFRSKENPKIHLAAKKIDDGYEFWVKDNGIGFEGKYAEQIFNVFQRLHSRREYPGTGIGLAICKKIAERHGGRIWANSAVGKGSTFHFTIKG